MDLFQHFVHHIATPYFLTEMWTLFRFVVPNMYLLTYVFAYSYLKDADILEEIVIIGTLFPVALNYLVRN